MQDTIKLNEKNLSRITEKVRVPTYDRSKLKTGIVHIGVGNFFRAHLAYYTEHLLQQGGTEWGICGIGLLDRDAKMYHILSSQDRLYTLIIKEPDGRSRGQVIGSIIELKYAPENPEAVLEKLADPDVKIISLTITEGGYNFDSSTGEFNISAPAIQWDLKNPLNPKTIFGYLSQALHMRRDRGLPGFTILSCDNIQKNGDVCKKMLHTFVQTAEPDLIEWIEKHVTFPNSMVDRITPVTTPVDIDYLNENFGIEDKWPVLCEPFIQWVIEDNFSSGRPAWQQAGVQLVHEVEHYEKMKIRLLNAGHTLLGFSGSLNGYSTIDETVSDPLFANLLRKFMDEEVTPILEKIEGIDLENYKDSLLFRFSNPNIKDPLTRICDESSAKIPKFLLPTIHEQLDRNGSIKFGTFIVAAWCRLLELSGTSGYKYEIQDVLKDKLLRAAKASVGGDPLSFLKIKTIFGDLADSHRFVQTYIEMINLIHQDKIDNVIRRLVK